MPKMPLGAGVLQGSSQLLPRGHRDQELDEFSVFFFSIIKSSPYKPIFTSNPVFLFLCFGRLLPVNIGLFLKPEALNIPLFIRSVVILSLSFPTPHQHPWQVIERF